MWGLQRIGESVLTTTKHLGGLHRFGESVLTTAKPLQVWKVCCVDVKACILIVEDRRVRFNRRNACIRLVEVLRILPHACRWFHRLRVRFVYHKVCRRIPFHNRVCRKLVQVQRVRLCNHKACRRLAQVWRFRFDSCKACRKFVEVRNARFDSPKSCWRLIEVQRAPFDFQRQIWGL